ncbi:MAG: hypothetical protein ACLSAH_04890 [Bilophila wadsworthia]
MGAGSDVVSRLAAARNQEGRERLGHLVLRFLQRVVSDVGVPVAELCIAGNTAMTSILLNEDVAGLCAAPYRLTEPGGRTAELPGLPQAWIPAARPVRGRGHQRGHGGLLYGEPPEFPFCLRTWGRTANSCSLWIERSFIASVPLGPSLEGIGLRRRVADTGSVSSSGSVRSAVSRGHRQHGTETDLRHGLFVAAGCAVADRFPRRHGSPCVGFCFTSGRPPARDRRTRGRWLEPAVARRHGACRGRRGGNPRVKAAFSLALSLLAASGLESRALARVCLGGALGGTCRKPHWSGWAFCRRACRRALWRRATPPCAGRRFC